MKHKLWSVWDMLTRDAESFIEILAGCERVHVLVEYGTEAFELGAKITEDISKRATDHFDNLGKAFEGMSVKAASAAVRRGQKMLKKGVTYRELGEANRDIFSRFKDEMEGRQFFFLDDREAALFEAKEPPFGDNVEIAFPSAAEDIVEASKCLGLARYTAAVFHLMRAMEWAVQELGAELKIENCEREWGKLLSDMEAKIRRMPRGDKKDSWSESHSHLYHVKQAWRNKTMHPKKTYTSEEAEAVFSAVRTFMRHLAKLLPDRSVSAAV